MTEKLYKLYIHHTNFICYITDNHGGGRTFVEGHEPYEPSDPGEPSEPINQSINNQSMILQFYNTRLDRQ